jgi:hypothetical protein
MLGAKTFTITSQPYYDQYNQCYKNIMTLNAEPQGPLRQLVKKIQLPKLSPFQVEGPCNPIPKCALAIQHFSNDYNSACYKGGCHLMTPNDVPNLMSFLLANGYQFETQLTNMLNQSEIKLSDKKIAFTITYYGTNQPNVTYMR